MIPNRNKTLVGLPCVRIEADADPIPLCKTTGVHQRDTWPSDLRGLSGPVEVEFPQTRRTTPTQVIRRPSHDPSLSAKFVAAGLVMYAIAIGIAVGMWWQ